ncbi:MAG: extracellular solute-binding protein, partial [Burkholderiaceae bacterium]
MTHRLGAFARRLCVLLVLPLLLVCGNVRAQNTLTIWWERGSVQAQDDALAQVIARFESRYKVKVALTLLAAQELLPKLTGALAAGTPPDIGFGTVLDLQATASWAHDDQLEDISSVIDPIRSRFDAAALATVFLYDDASQRRAFYAFPLWQQVMQLQYWRSMLVDAGLSADDIPADWDGYWDFWCATVQPAYRQRTGTRAYGLGLPMGVDASLSAMAFLTFLDAYNVRLVDDAGKLRVDDPAVRAGLIQAMTRYTQPYVRGCAPPSSRHWHDADSAVAFQNRTTVLVPTMALASAPESLDGKYQAAPIATTRFPRKPDAGTLVYRASVKTGLVFKQARNKQDAKKFVSFLLDDAQ